MLVMTACFATDGVAGSAIGILIVTLLALIRRHDKPLGQRQLWLPALLLFTVALILDTPAELHHAPTAKLIFQMLAATATAATAARPATCSCKRSAPAGGSCRLARSVRCPGSISMIH